MDSSDRPNTGGPKIRMLDGQGDGEQEAGGLGTWGAGFKVKLGGPEETGIVLAVDEAGMAFLCCVYFKSTLDDQAHLLFYPRLCGWVAMQVRNNTTHCDQQQRFEFQVASPSRRANVRC
jgi:hypothetical protein